MELAGDQAIKDQLAANTRQAVEQGVFGLPSFIVGDELWFGRTGCAKWKKLDPGLPDPKRRTQKNKRSPRRRLRLGRRAILCRYAPDHYITAV
jgi:hypothetical protein